MIFNERLVIHMKLGVMNPVINYMPFEDALKYLSDLGVQCIEIGAGGYPGDAHLKPCEVIGNQQKIDEYKRNTILKFQL